MLKIEDVKVGDEYQLTTPALKGFALNAIYTIEKIVGEYIKFKNATDPVRFENLVYFKKVKQSQYTFDDLIDVAVQSWKDGVTTSITLVEGILCVHKDRLSDAIVAVGDKASSQFYSDAIHAIQSLYKETFVIECEDDLKRVKSNPKITLNNGEVVPFTFKETAKDHLIFYDQACGHNLISFVFLKGATVEQERGRDD